MNEYFYGINLMLMFGIGMMYTMILVLWVTRKKQNEHI